MRLPWKKSRPDFQSERAPARALVPASASEVVPEPKNTTSFDGDLEDFAVLRHHAVRALCGVLMDRHSACKSPHPFCGSSHQQYGDLLTMLIAHAVPQRDAATGGDLIGIYLCNAEEGPASEMKSGGEEWDPIEYIARMTYTQSTPSRKLVINPPKDGRHLAQYGPIVNPVEGNYATGRINPDDQRELYSNPTPAHCRWQYWESGLTNGDNLIPEFHCLQVSGEWWVVDVDRVRGLAQQVAALDLADNPEHNFGIHEREGAVYVSTGDGSELSKVLRENLQ